MKQIAFALSAFLTLSAPLWADAPVIERVSTTQLDDGDGAVTWRFDVTLSHPDTGWDHYADGWRVLDIDGTVLGNRVLGHPHVHEQPFTRSLSGVAIPKGVTEVQIEARDNVDGWAGEPVSVSLVPE